MLLTLLISLMPPLDLPARTRQRRKKTVQKPIGKSQTVEFELQYDFSMQAIPTKIIFVTNLPKTIPDRQQILDIQYSEKPSRIFTKNDNDYVEFVFTRPTNNFTLKINIKARLFRYDLAAAREKYKQKPPPRDPNLINFLKHEKYIEKDAPSIQEAAEEIAGRNEIDTVRNIYEYVTNKLRYRAGKQEVGAAKTLQKKTGACTEYSDLFVALCRAKNIPARVVKGYVTESNNAPQHAWAEVFLKEYGWVPFDLIYDDVEQKSAKNERFQNLRPIYIYLTNIRNDPILRESITAHGFWIGQINLQESITFR